MDICHKYKKTQSRFLSQAFSATREIYNCFKFQNNKVNYVDICFSQNNGANNSGNNNNYCLKVFFEGDLPPLMITFCISDELEISIIGDEEQYDKYFDHCCIRSIETMLDKLGEIR